MYHRQTCQDGRVCVYYYVGVVVAALISAVTAALRWVSVKMNYHRLVAGCLSVSLAMSNTNFIAAVM